MYTADSTFLRDLRRLDPNLGCKYEPAHEHFVITYRRATGEPVPVLRIENPDGSFRRPGHVDIEALQLGDTHRIPMRDRLKQSAQYMADVREKQNRDRKDDIRNMTKDNKIQLTRTMSKLAGGGGKGNSTFRRIEPAQKGQAI